MDGTRRIKKVDNQTEEFIIRGIDLAYKRKKCRQLDSMSMKNDYPWLKNEKDAWLVQRCYSVFEDRLKTKILATSNDWTFYFWISIQS